MSQNIIHGYQSNFIQNKSNENLRSIQEIPLPYRNLFNEYINFNLVQSKVIKDVLYSDKSIVVSAPTGSGKTVIFELAIIRLLMQYEQQQQQNFKIIYVAPIKSLCSEKFTEWYKKFQSFGINCFEMTGDCNDTIDIQNIKSSINFIITTPEKWDSITRKWKDNINFIKSIKLFMIDEVHLLNEDTRGPILETIVSRMKTVQFSLGIKNNPKNIMNNNHNDFNLRFVAVSATIPNIEDLADWLGDKNDPAIFYKISDDLRPVKLQKYVVGFTGNLTGFRFDISLNYKLPGVIRKYSNGKPTLVFCNSRKSAEMATAVLVENFPNTSMSDNHKAVLKKLARRFQDLKLRDYIQKGIAYHHAGLSVDDRGNVEAAFRRSLIMVLVSTNTLAMGVNLPAHLVIIKSTETYSRNSYVEYSESSLLQMIGRAGRPQYDENGVAVIMTHQRNVKKYENLVNGCEPVESHLHKHLAEHLNSEIVLQTINDLELAMEWIRSTFLYVRAVKSPLNYGLAYGMTKENVEKKLEEMCLIQINALESNGLIVKDQSFGLSLGATQFGRLMARYYISFETIKIFRTIRGNESLLEMLNLIIRCKEFSEFAIRVNDKKVLNELNNKPIRFPVRGKVKNKENKISCLIQAIFGNITISEVSLMQEAFRMIRIGERVSKCLSEFIRLYEKQSTNGIYKALLNSLILSKCFKSKLWENSEYICKQLKKIGPVYSNLLVNAGKTNLQTIRNTDPRTLEMILGKTAPFGSEILETLNYFPDYILDVKPKNSNKIEIEIQQNSNQYQFTNGNNCTILVGDTENNTILFNDKLDHEISESGIFHRILSIPNSKTHAIHVHLIHSTLVGVDRIASIILNPIDETATNQKNQKKTKKKNETKSQVTKTTHKKLSTKTLKPSSSSSLASIPESNQKTSNSNANVDYSSLLLDDDEDLNGLDDSILLIDEHSNMNKNYESNIVANNETFNVISQFVSQKSGIKRKLENFEYTEKSKINKIFVEEEKFDTMTDDWMNDEFEDEIILINENEKENFIENRQNVKNFEEKEHNNSIRKPKTLSQYFKPIKNSKIQDDLVKVAPYNRNKINVLNEHHQSSINLKSNMNFIKNKENSNQFNKNENMNRENLSSNSNLKNPNVIENQLPNSNDLNSIFDNLNEFTQCCKNLNKNEQIQQQETNAKIILTPIPSSKNLNRNSNLLKRKNVEDLSEIIFDLTRTEDPTEIIDLSQKKNLNSFICKKQEESIIDLTKSSKSNDLNFQVPLDVSEKSSDYRKTVKSQKINNFQEIQNEPLNLSIKLLKSSISRNVENQEIVIDLANPEKACNQTLSRNLTEKKEQMSSEKSVLDLSKGTKNCVETNSFLEIEVNKNFPKEPIKTFNFENKSTTFSNQLNSKIDNRNNISENLKTVPQILNSRKVDKVFDIEFPNFAGCSGTFEIKTDFKIPNSVSQKVTNLEDYPKISEIRQTKYNSYRNTTDLFFNNSKGDFIKSRRLGMRGWSKINKNVKSVFPPCETNQSQIMNFYGDFVTAKTVHSLKQNCQRKFGKKESSISNMKSVDNPVVEKDSIPKSVKIFNTCNAFFHLDDKDKEVSFEPMDLIEPNHVKSSSNDLNFPKNDKSLQIIASEIQSNKSTGSRLSSSDADGSDKVIEIATEKTNEAINSNHFSTESHNIQIAKLIEEPRNTNSLDILKSNVENISEKSFQDDSILELLPNESASFSVPFLYATIKKFNHPQVNLIHILVSLCDKNLSENHKRCNLQNFIIEMSDDFDPPTMVNSKNTQFLEESIEDKTLETFIEETSKVRNSLQVVRIPDNDNGPQVSIENDFKKSLPLKQMSFDEESRNKDNENYFKIPQNKYSLDLLDYDECLKKDKKFNPYGLQLHQRKKCFKIARPSTTAKIMDGKLELDKIKRNLALENINTKYNHDLTYDQESYFKDVATCLLADTSSFKQYWFTENDENLSKNHDDDDKASNATFKINASHDESVKETRINNKSCVSELIPDENTYDEKNFLTQNTINPFSVNTEFDDRSFQALETNFTTNEISSARIDLLNQTQTLSSPFKGSLNKKNFPRNEFLSNETQMFNKTGTKSIVTLRSFKKSDSNSIISVEEEEDKYETNLLENDVLLNKTQLFDETQSHEENSFMEYIYDLCTPFESGTQNQTFLETNEIRKKTLGLSKDYTYDFYTHNEKVQCGKVNFERNEFLMNYEDNFRSYNEIKGLRMNYTKSKPQKQNSSDFHENYIYDFRSSDGRQSERTNSLESNFSLNKSDFKKQSRENKSLHNNRFNPYFFENDKPSRRSQDVFEDIFLSNELSLSSDNKSILQDLNFTQNSYENEENPFKF